MKRQKAPVTGQRHWRRPGEQERRDAFSKTNSDIEAAAFLRRADPGGPDVLITVAAFRAWRKSRGLVARHDPRRLPPAEVRRRRRILRSSASLAEAARRVGVHPLTLRTFRQRYGEASGPGRRPTSAGPAIQAAAARRAAYEGGATDREVAQRFGISVAGAIQWRRRHLADLDRSRVLPKEEQVRRLAAYRGARSDAEAARELGISISAFRAWRTSKRLPSQTRRARLRRDGQRSAAYQQTQSDADAARRLGIERHTFTSWRKAHGLYPKSKPVSYEEEARRIVAYLLSDSDRLAAASVGLPRATFTRWRIRRALPPHPQRLVPGRELAALLAEVGRADTAAPNAGRMLELLAGRLATYASKRAR